MLTDGLLAEREQGITIDVAYRYFSTSRRKFILADAPGHEQYTRNMASAASNSDLAALLVDARRGLLEQTCRHIHIASLFGIKNIVIAVNKMDLIGYEEGAFKAVESAATNLAQELGFVQVTCIPVSALKGDNIVEPSADMPWHKGPTLRAYLETVDIEPARDAQGFKLPVQWVNRPNAEFRGYAGTIIAGTVRPGDEITVMPSGQCARVKEIVTIGGPLQSASA